MAYRVADAAPHAEDLFETYSQLAQFREELELFFSSAPGFTNEGGSQEAAE